MNIPALPKRFPRAATAVLAGVLTASLLVASGASAAPVAPQLELIEPHGKVVAYAYPGEPVYVDPGILVASLGAPFEIRVKRESYTEPITVEQVLYGEGDETASVELSTDILDGWNGIAEFFRLEIVDRSGATVVDTTMSFCPGGYLRERVNDDGPVRPIYPETCFGNPFTKGIVWGIDANWAVSTYNFYGPGLAIDKGRYTMEMSIAPDYIEMFDIDPAKATATIPLRVKRIKDECPKRCFRKGAADRSERAGAVPVMDAPDPSILPDLISLPAWGINVNNGKKRSWLTFGATVWNGGSSDLVVEGFRRQDEDVMDGWQYFYDGDEPVGKAQAGELEFDGRDGHFHWHFLQFAEYTLLDQTQMEIIKSKKEAFCLAPTDAIDMLVPNARWNPGEIGLGTACGSPSSIWVREVLANGWGDTYFQGVPGQSFNITELPNGTYYIGVRANPLGLLHEQSDANNFEVREVILEGEAGSRTVTVPPWNGIDTEGTLGKH